MTGPSEQQNDAAGSVTAYLDVRDALIAAGASLTDQIAEGKSGGRPWARLLASHLREVLRRLDIAIADDRLSMTPQYCALGEHGDWAADSEDVHACPWCAKDQLAAELREARAEAGQLIRERDEARLIARILNRRDLNLHLEYEIRLGLGLVPDWLRSGSWDPKSNESIGATSD